LLPAKGVGALQDTQCKLAFVLETASPEEYGQAIAVSSWLSDPDGCGMPVYRSDASPPWLDEFWAAYGVTVFSFADWWGRNLDQLPPCCSVPSPLSNDGLALAAYLGSLAGRPIWFSLPHLALPDLTDDTIPEWSTDLQALNALYAQYTDRLNYDEVVVTFIDDLFALGSALYAAHKHLRLFWISDFNQLQQIVEITEPHAVTLFGRPVHFTHRAVTQIRHILSFDVLLRGILGKIPFGFITGRSLDALSRQVCKVLYPLPTARPETLMVLQLFSNPVPSPDPTLTILTRKDATVETFRAFTHTPIRMLNLNSHGHEDKVFLGQDVICGARYPLAVDRPDLLESNCKVPACAHGSPCTEGDIIKAYDVKAVHVFINSCTGYQLTPGSYADDYLLSLNFLDGWASSYVTTYRVQNARWQENLYFHHLVDAGYTLGDATRLLNNALIWSRHETGCYLLVGDPAFRVTKPRSSHRVTLETKADPIEIHLGDIRAPFLVLEARDSIFCHNVMTYGVYLEVLELDPWSDFLCYAIDVDVDEDTVYIFLYDLADLNLDTLHLRVHTTPFWEDSAGQALQTWLDNAQLAQNYFKVLPAACKGKLSAIETRIVTLARKIMESHLRLTGYSECLDDLGQLHDQMAEVEELTLVDILDQVEQSIFRLNNRYEASFMLTETESREVCPYCYALCTVSIYNDFLRRWKRRVYFCSTCGIIFDASDGYPLIQIEGPDSLAPGESVVQRIRLVNPWPSPLRAWMGVRVERVTFDHERPWGFCTHPDHCVVEVPPLDKVEVPIEIACQPDTLAHRYFIQMYMIHNMALLNANKPIFVLSGRKVHVVSTRSALTAAECEALAGSESEERTPHE